MKLLLALGSVVGALGTVHADAQAHQCAIWRHGDCVRWVGRHDQWRVGYVFGPSYGYTAYGALPQTYVTRYHLSPRDRYVYQGENIYVVDPATYAVTRILNAVSR